MNLEKEIEDQPIWCLVANTEEESKHFLKGSKIYCCRSETGLWPEKIRVIGQHRKSKRFINIILDSTQLTNFRAKQVHKPAVKEKIIGYSWGRGEKALELIKEKIEEKG